MKTKNKAWPLVGNGHIIDFLSKSIKNNNLAGSYIFYGPDNLGKTTVANFFAQTLLCENRKADSFCGECLSCKKFLIKREDSSEGVDFGGVHSDFYLIKKESDKKNISIEQAREFIRKLSMSSFLNSYKIGIVKHADSLSIGASNALLKTLEEPKDKVVVILVTSNIDAIPATIASRSQILKFNPVSSDIIYDHLINDHRASRSSAKKFSSICLGRPALAIKFLQDSEFYNTYLERVSVFLNFFNEDLNERFRTIDGLIDKKKMNNKKESGNQELVKLTSRIIEIWMGLTRDMLLLEFNRADIVQHKINEKELIGARTKVTSVKLLKIIESLQKADIYLRANVSPKLVLENVAVNI